MAKSYTCKSCGKTSVAIGVESVCTQRLSIPDDNWDDLIVGDTLSGYCLECGALIPGRALKRILGHAPRPDYKALVEEVVNDVETEGCDGCGTVSKTVLDKARKALGYKNV